MSKIHKAVDAIKHPKDSRVDIPTTECAGEEAGNVKDDPKTAQYKKFRHDFDRGTDPQLYWLNKDINDNEDTQNPSLKVDIRSLYVHEDVQPEVLIDKLHQIKEIKSEESSLQGELFSAEEMPNVIDDELAKVAAYYKHSSEWKNRLIQGDSLLVMNSLLKREGMAGQVQCMYFDPPYGIRFGGNWQIMINSPKMSHESKDSEATFEPEMLKAYRDTWELAVHSYLSYLRDRLILARELLTTSGSVFVQISDENVHLVRSIMDEVFGSENFVSQIFYKKTSGAGSPNKLLAPASVGDYIIWYAKDKTNMKFRPLFIPKVFGEDGSSAYNAIELQDGERMSIAQWEKKNNRKFEYESRPKGSRPYTLDNLTSQSGTDIGRFDIQFKGKTYKAPSNGVWKTNQEGIERLKQANRIDVSDKGRVGYVRYFDDFCAQPLTSLWTDAVSSFMSDKLYVVQSSKKAIQRCILMTTDPGDLVLDPTCGSGTTAFLSEQWGRRWITIDTSRIAVNIAKIRLIKNCFPYYELFDKNGQNIRQGFDYQTATHLKLSNIANGEDAETEILYDQPKVNNKRIRVAGPFTVETLQSDNILSPDYLRCKTDEAEEYRLFQERIFTHLHSSGIHNGQKGHTVTFDNLEAVASSIINARGYYKVGEEEEKLAYFLIGPKFGTVSRKSVNDAVREFRKRNIAEGASWLVLLGFSFEDSIDTKDYDFGDFVVTKVRMHDDLLQDGLLKKDKMASSFITIGEPDIILVPVEGETSKQYVEIRGLDIYDPLSDNVSERPLNQIAYWEIDDRYDGSRFVVRGIHFCGGDKKEFNDWKKGLSGIASSMAKKKAERTLSLEFNEELWDTLYGYTSEPLTYEPGRRIAVRVISQFGEECTKVLTM